MHVRMLRIPPLSLYAAYEVAIYSNNHCFYLAKDFKKRHLTESSTGEYATNDMAAVQIPLENDQFRYECAKICI
jgi:hypothetical protein